MTKLGDLLKAAGISGVGIQDRQPVGAKPEAERPYAPVRWTDPLTGMPKRRELCGLLVPAAKITVNANGRSVSTSSRAVRMIRAESHPWAMEWVTPTLAALRSSGFASR
jgi:hypothetical protein